ncbi:hypothetical protein MGG_15839 [Pyricularia oryzae 70-15]|uniref:Uncharacterized protein n=3 Tax=Pyricularia oryzae TaxID=318829 RepID=G4MZM8_PYRO7|nr:uncharacterized protein MGG_15839 [Pyricularia oryzae 70-15]EHA55392.1 hypothetical protein MGG_15839 [Pyricularia oryzae 70-15]ELQ37208.1 hypothetical protein OOU_Y34scaffold00610g45 [Pyricularia oryzae Y34]KAI7924651.1 hypothetical protein M0657_004515 [Pyricularia oryzae]KAI7925240.1 hypothetical protein M9X92_003419 [Pyricularia oryzae]
MNEFYVQLSMYAVECVYTLLSLGDDDQIRTAGRVGLPRAKVTSSQTLLFRAPKVVNAKPPKATAS